MKKQILLLLAISAFSTLLNAQVHTVNISSTQGFFDSTYVVQANGNDSMHAGNHPGFGGYSNAEIYICDNATLKYNYSMGTSSNPTFYLGNNARLESYTSFNAHRVYMKANSSIECFGGNFLVEELRREPSTTIVSTGYMFFDSSYTQINYTFTGWPNNQSPCSSATANNEILSETSAINVYPNPTQDWLYIRNLPMVKGSSTCYIYDMLGRLVISQLNDSRNETQIDCQALKTGNYHLSVRHDGAVLQNIVFTKY